MCEKKVYGSGILPISINDHGEVFVLCGQERYVHNWKGSLKWSGFEGGVKDDESCEDNATREFLEETIGCVSLYDASTQEEILDLIKKEEYFLKLYLGVQSETEVRFHVTYVIQTEYNDECIKRFNSRLDKLLKLNSEMQTFAAMCMENDWIYEGVSWEGHFVTSLINVEAIDCKTCRIVVQLETQEICSAMVEADARYIEWFTLRNQIDAHCVPELTFCLQIERNSVGKFIKGFVIDDYIEKKQIMWYNVKEFKKKEKNFFLQFRPYFLPIVQHIVQETDL